MENQIEFVVAKATILDRIVGFFRISRYLETFRRAEILSNGRFRKISSTITIE